MWKQIKRISGVRLCNLFGLNEARFSRDKKKKNRLIGLGAVFLFLGLMIIVYMGGLAFGLVTLGMGELVPLYLAAVTGLITLFFSIVRAGGVIFDLRSYEKEMALPVRAEVVVLSRFWTMYVQDLLMSALVMVPGAAVYAWFLKPEWTFYVITLLGTLLLPLLPLTVASVVGMAVSMISSRMKHRNIASIVLSIIFVIAAMILPSVTAAGMEDMSKAELAGLSDTLGSAIGRIYPPAAMFADGAVKGDWGRFALFALLSVGVFAAFILVMRKYYASICSALSATAARRDFVMGVQTGASPLKALYRKEARQYFASSLYVMNTGVGYILMVLFAGAVLVMGVEAVETAVGMPGVVKMAAPVALALMAGLMPTTCSSISMEGRNWWIVQSAPVPAKTVFDSKILLTLTMGLPACVLSAVLLWIALRPGFVDGLWMLVLPAVYTVFSAVVGIALNLRFPVMKWDNEAMVIKQSMASLFAMLAGMIGPLIPGVLIFIAPAGVRGAVYPAAAVVFAALTAGIYGKNNRVMLKNIE